MCQPYAGTCTAFETVPKTAEIDDIPSNKQKPSNSPIIAEIWHTDEADSGLGYIAEASTGVHTNVQSNVDNA